MVLFRVREPGPQTFCYMTQIRRGKKITDNGLRTRISHFSYVDWATQMESWPDEICRCPSVRKIMNARFPMSLKVAEKGEIQTWGQYKKSSENACVFLSWSLPKASSRKKNVVQRRTNKEQNHFLFPSLELFKTSTMC